MVSFQVSLMSLPVRFPVQRLHLPLLLRYHEWSAAEEELIVLLVQRNQLEQQVQQNPEALISLRRWIFEWYLVELVVQAVLLIHECVPRFWN